MMQQPRDSTFQRPSNEDLRAIITNPNEAKKLVEWANRLGKSLKDMGLTTSQIRALFGEVRQIQAEWRINRQRAFRRLVLLRPKMAYRARRERGRAVEELVAVLDPALNHVIQADPRPEGQQPGTDDNQDDNFQRFAEFFEAILAYHKAYGGQ
ncbi:MAG: type III-A CRISPR-associated protein Csm2 [Anaerolineae bacterium]|nr:type III-A CRISPR-associated protein Csm2 [Anaerolineae bacterium]MDW8098089.1 type III-A CRISPR-associated protein Csm2 [Anaerolineae bacterium]